MSLGAPQLLSWVICFWVISLAILILWGVKARRRWGEIVMRGLALALLGLALLGPYREQVLPHSRATVLVDISDSMNEAQAEELLAQTRDLAQNNVNLTIFPFAGKLGSLPLSMAEATNFHLLKNRWSSLNIGESNLEIALRGAANLEAENILIVSDGFENRGEVNNVQQILNQHGKKLFPIVPLEAESVNQNFGLTKLHAPLVAPAERSVTIRSAVKNETDQRESGLLEIRQDGKTIQKRTVTIDPGKELVITAESDPLKGGIKEVQALFTPVNPKIKPTTKTLYIASQERERLLILNGDERDGYLLNKALEQQKFRIENLTGAEAKGKFPDLNDFFSVIFNNIHISQLPGNAAAKVEEYVRKGGSLLMIGGNQSFGLGGYIGTPIERVLPVDMLPPQTAKKRLNVAVSMILDKSRSMANDDKIYYAKEAAGAVVKTLKDDDFVEVIGFDSSPFIVIKLSPLSAVRGNAIDRINRLFPAGRTNLLPALHEAKRSFAKVEAGRKHMLILTDGKIPDAGPYYMELISQLRKEGVTVSVVLLGSESDTQLLKDMARAGGGAFHQTTSAQSLARIFIDDIRVSTGERTLKESSEFSVRPGTAGIKSTRITSFPPLKGYVQTKPKSDANLELIVFDSSKADPLLSSWDYGQGRAIAFTSDANGRWSSLWAPWSNFHLFWSEIVESLSKKEGGPNEAIKFDLRYFVEKGKLILDLAVFSEGVSGNVTAVLATPEKENSSISFEPIALGHYRSRVEQPIAGKYTLNISIGDRKLTPVAIYLPGDLFGEKTGQGFNRPLLEQLASVTDGKVNPSKDELTEVGSRIVIKNDLTYHLVAMAILLIILEVIKREVGLNWLRGFRRAKA